MAAPGILGSQSCDEPNEVTSDNTTTISLSIQNLITPLLETSSNKPPMESTLFPGLPFELRTMIFDFAFPPDDRILPVEYKFDSEEGEGGYIPLKFTIRSNVISVHPRSARMFDIGLLATCVEAA